MNKVTYKEARVYLEEMSKYGSVLGLDAIRGLLRELGNPQEDLKFIHIAGTNGKGSVLAYTSTILSKAGYRTGRYVSPAVMGYLEKIQVDGRWISEQEFAEITTEVQKAIANLKVSGGLLPTLFEVETAIAFLYFKKMNCDLVVLETGLGGALDATNIIENTLCAVFTNISVDHLGVIGDTLEEIAKTKAGIMKIGCQVVSAGQREEVAKVLRQQFYEICGGEEGGFGDETAEKHGVQNGYHTTYQKNYREADMRQLQVLSEDHKSMSLQYKNFKNLTSHLTGFHQKKNLATALEVIMTLRDMGYEISDEAVSNGVLETKWSGRYTCLMEDPIFMIDGAHNEDAAYRLAESLQHDFPDKKRILILGVFKDKDYEKITSILCPLASQVYTVNLPNKERTLSAADLAGVVEQSCMQVKSEATIKEAVEDAIKEAEKIRLAGESSVIIACGSLSYLGIVKELVENMEKTNAPIDARRIPDV